MALDDFQVLTIRGRSRVDLKNRRADKGHAEEMQHFSRAILGREPLSITQRDGIRAAICCLRAFESARSGEVVAIDSTLWHPGAESYEV
ncbi:MAG: hypothetical protein KDA42_17440 [Planctomycetales bacterium]|nr:hypothetical protein [Planctomycetales bacterium]